MDSVRRNWYFGGGVGMNEYALNVINAIENDTVSPTILTSLQKNVINSFIVDLLNINLTQTNFFRPDLPSVSIIKALYPRIGGTLNAHKYNWVDPRDADDAYRLTYYNAFIHDANGDKPLSNNSYCDTHFIPVTKCPANSVSMSFYSNENLVGNNAAECEMGAYVNNKYAMLRIRTSTNVCASYIASGSIVSEAVSSDTDSLGWYLANRYSALSNRIVKNGILKKESTIDNSAGVFPENSIYIFAQHFSSTAANHTNRRCQLNHIGAGISPDAELLFNAAIQKLNMRLGRLFFLTGISDLDESTILSSSTILN